jgi:tetratricopeptide (TPR) repeat protein
VRLRQERYDEALGDFCAALELDPSDWGATGNRAVGYSALGRYEDALADCERALELGHPDTSWVLATRADTYRHLGHYEDALASFTMAIEADGVNATALAGRGQTYLALGRRDEARRDLRRAMELNPDLTAEVSQYLADT